MLEFSVQHAEVALSTATEDVGDGIQGHDNDTESLQLLSHLDPPADSVYMICGVLIALVLVGVIIVLLAVTISRHKRSRYIIREPRHVNSLKIESKRSKSVKAKLSQLYLKLRQQPKMVGSNGTMIAIRLVRSKLRKREDHSNAVHPETGVVQTATSPVSTIVAPSYPGEGCCTQTSVTTTSTDLGNSTAVEQDNNVYATANPADQIVWQFPPPYPPPHTPAQYALYNDQDTLVHALPSDRSGFAKGFRKNIGGQWRRLLKRKPESETCAIPPELKDQLKTIYVY